MNDTVVLAGDVNMLSVIDGTPEVNVSIIRGALTAQHDEGNVSLFIKGDTQELNTSHNNGVVIVWAG
ncbi:MAG: hypothetical protein J6112_03595 [Clostridia bacterium]|nr:hypothetical protein [Clostridia bacterium]